MATLAARLDAIREGFQAQAPAEALEVMHRATADIGSSGQVARALGEGDALPTFELTDETGRLVRSAELLARGPLVLTFFRGHW